MSFIQKGVLKGRLFGAVETRNIFYAQVEPSALDTFQDLWLAYITGVVVNVKDILTSAWASSAIQIFEWNSNEWVPMDEIDYVQAGIAGGDTLANLVAAVVIGKVPFQRGFGRKFFSGISETMANGNSLVANAMAVLVNVAVNYVAVYTGPNGGVLGPGIFKADHTFHSFSTGFASSLLGSMRRRKPGLGI